MTRTEFDFDVIGGPTAPSLASLLQRPAPSPPGKQPAAPASLDPQPARPKSLAQ